MLFLVGLIEVAVAALIAWWIRRGWYNKPVLSRRLEYAGFKVGVGVFLAYMVPGSILLGFKPIPAGAGDVVLIAAVVFVLCAFGLYVASFVVGEVEGIRTRKEQRRSGHPTRPNLRAPWQIALVAGAAGFFLYLGVVYMAAERYWMAAKSLPVVTTQSTSEYLQGWLIGGGIGFWVFVGLAYAIQRVRIWKANREYEELIAGLETRLQQGTTGEKQHNSGRLKAGRRKP